MEKFKLKLLNPRSSELRRRFGNSIKTLFNIQDSACTTYPSNFKKKSLINRLKVFTSLKSKENLSLDEGEITPVKKLSKSDKYSFVHNSSDKAVIRKQTWIRPRDPESVRSSKRFWNSLDIPQIPVIQARKPEPVDLWTSFNTTPIKPSHLNTISQSEVSQDSDSSYYSLNSNYSVSSFYSINSFYSVDTSFPSTPQRDCQSTPMDYEEPKPEPLPSSGKRRLYRAIRK